MSLAICLPGVDPASFDYIPPPSPAAGCSRSLRGRTEADEKAVAAVADRIAAEVDELIAEGVMPAEDSRSGGEWTS